MRLRWLTIVLMSVGLLTACAAPEPTATPTAVPTLTKSPVRLAPPPESAQVPDVLSTPSGPIETAFEEEVLRCHEISSGTGTGFCYGGLVLEAGAERVLRTLEGLIQAGAIDSTADTHHIAHDVGRQTARVFGLNGEAFLGCSTQFNYGCQHGYFERALAESPDATVAASRICSDLVGAQPTKTAFYCYHGVGHGVMMASAYDLDQALTVCDSLGTAMASDGCWQGVFMENVNAVMRGDARAGVFSETDPLAPCNQVAERYRWECYINHAGRLITFFDMDVGLASHACLEALPRYASACIESLGLMVSNPAWQKTLAGPESASRNIEVTLELCRQFPVAYRGDCVWGGVDNILNFDGTRLDRALRLCGTADAPYREGCYLRVGKAIKWQVVKPDERFSLCQEVVAKYRETCVAGAGLKMVDGRPVIAGELIFEKLPAPDAESISEPEVREEQAASIEVRVAGGGFDPERVTITVGETVRWVNVSGDFLWPASNVHPTHELYPGFDAGRPIAPQGAWSFTFYSAGVWGYHDHMNPARTAIVVVEESP